MENKKTAVIQCIHIWKKYNKGKENELTALKDVSFEVKEGEMVAVMGKSGSGKSTLMHILGCLDYYDMGKYFLEGEKIQKLSDRKMAAIRNEKIGIVMQNFALVEEFTALENVILPLDFARKCQKEKNKLATEALKRVEMYEEAEQICATMSGGQKQRVAIARAIVNEPAILLADEPTGALDVHTTENILNLLKNLNESGMTIVMITHDPLVAQVCTRTVYLKDGTIVSEM